MIPAIDHIVVLEVYLPRSETKVVEMGKLIIIRLMAYS